MKNAIIILGVVTLLTGVAPRTYAQQTEPSLNLDKAYDIFRQGETKLQVGDYRGAIEDYDQVLKLDAVNTDAYVSRGVARFGLGDKQGAIKDFTQALQLDANNADIYRKRGGVYMTLGNKRAAREDFQQATKLSSSQRSGANSAPQQNPGIQP